MAGGFCKRANRHRMFGDEYVSAGHPLFVAAADRLRHAERALSYRAQPPSTSRRREPQHAGQPAAAGAVEAAAPGGGGKVRTRGMAVQEVRHTLAVAGGAGGIPGDTDRRPLPTLLGSLRLSP